MRWLIIPIIIFGVFSFYKVSCARGIPTGTEQYLKNHQKKGGDMLPVGKPVSVSSEDHNPPFYFFRFQYWDYNRVILENGYDLQLNQPCPWGLVKRITSQYVVVEKRFGGDIYVFRNNLMVSESTIKDKSDDSITTQLINKTKVKEF